MTPAKAAPLSPMVIPRSTRTRALNVAGRTGERPRWPTTAQERGQALRWFMQTHSVSHGALRTAAEISSGTLISWISGKYDIVLQARRPNVERLLEVIANLEPSMSDAELHELFGVPEQFRSIWTLPRVQQPDAEVFQRVIGLLNGTAPVRLTTVPAYGCGPHATLVYRDAPGAARLERADTPLAGEPVLVGRLIKIEMLEE